MFIAVLKYRISYNQNQISSPLKNSRGQGLIEYLIIVALMSVATIGIMRALNQAVKAKFSSSIYAIQGVQKRAESETLEEKAYKKTDFSDFMNGAASQSSSKSND